MRKMLKKRCTMSPKQRWTHSTIAALSSGVPTLSFAYSIKAQGINRDIFGHTDYCMGAADLNAEAVAARVISMLDERVLRSGENWREGYRGPRGRRYVLGWS